MVVGIPPIQRLIELYSPTYSHDGEHGMAYLPDLFEQAARSKPSNIAVIEETSRWTFEELSAEVERIAALLKARIEGDTVGVLLLNCRKYVATMLAIWKAGKTAVPLNYLLPPAELAFIIKDSGMSGIVSSQFFNQALGAIKSLFGDKGVILMADDPEFSQTQAELGTSK